MAIRQRFPIASRQPLHVLAGALLVAVAAARENPSVSFTESLPTLLQRGSAAFAAGDFETAAAAFSEVEREFSDTPEWQEGRLPRKLLPLRGFAELRAGLASDATESLHTFLEQFPDEGRSRSIVLYTLALALRETGRMDEAIARFEAFEQENADSPQAALAKFQRAEIRFLQGSPAEAIALLDELASGAPTESLRIQARLRALQAAIEYGDDDMALQLLFREPWSVTTMPEIGVLAFAAMQVGDQQLAAGDGAAAIKAYRLVLPKRRLVETQRENLAALRTLFEERAPAVDAGAGSFWVDFYRARLARVSAQLEALESSEDYTAALQLRLGQAFLVAGRPREAWLVFERMVFDEETPDALRSQAHYRWILTAAGLELWEESLAIARAYMERYPEADEAAEALHLIARAHLEQHRLAEAETVLSEVIARFADHPVHGRALFTRGWVRVMQEAFPAARSDFDRYLGEHPDGPLAVNAGLWRALSFFFGRDYDEALTALATLAAANESHPLYPEIIYRQGTTLYAMRDFDRARAVMEQFASRWPMHERHPEALVLLGDILMGAGDLEAAMEQFARVPPDSGNTHAYAVFQTGKILRALKDYPAMASHFREYATAVNAGSRLRISEALYWVAWAEEQQGDPAAALPLFLDVLDRFGNDPAAGEIDSTLGALERLVRRMSSGGPGASLDDGRARGLVTDGFETWLKRQRSDALEAGKFTYHARLTLALADRHVRRKEPYQEEALLLELAGGAPLEALDAAALARVGLELRDIGSPEAEPYFRRVLASYPQSFERGGAYYGLADLARDRRRFDEARHWLARFEAETPTHPLAPRAAHLAARTMEEEGKPADALAAYEEILRLKSARGRIHAEALAGMSRCAVALGDYSRAIAYSQRIYTLYRAYPDLVTQAYLESGDLFAKTGDLEAAVATYREMLSLPDLGHSHQREEARQRMIILEKQLPDEINGAPSPPQLAEPS